MPGDERVSYRAVLANREFAAILVSQTLSTAGDQLARIAFAVLVYQRTGSPAAASATYAVSYLTYLVSGPVLSAISDRNNRVSIMVTCDLLRAPVVLLPCIGHPTVWQAFVSLALLGLLAPPFDSARSSVQPDLLPGDAYVVGNALMNIALQSAQVLGFVVGGAIVAATSVRGALGVDAATFLVSAGVVLGVIRPRPLAHTSSESSSLIRSALAGSRIVIGDRHLLRFLGYALIGSAAIIVPEGLAVPVATRLGSGATGAGVLTASLPAGFLVGSVFVLRIPPERRSALLPRLALIGAAPLVATPLVDNLLLMTLLWALAGAGGTVNLVASSAFMQQAPREVRGRAYGLAVTALNIVQGGFLLLGGLVAAWTTPRTSVAVLAFVVLLLLLAVVRLSGRGSQVQENSHFVRQSQG